MYNKKIRKKARKYAKEQEKIVSKLEYRIYTSKDNRSNRRNKAMRDYARVLYSSSFRRLQGKMQLLGINANKFNRNRLTHSLEVAQIARSIAYDLRLKRPVVAETASLAHDIGNPPFFWFPRASVVTQSGRASVRSSKRSVHKRSRHAPNIIHNNHLVFFI
jgi:hypothetical protein